MKSLEPVSPQTESRNRETVEFQTAHNHADEATSRLPKAMQLLVIILGSVAFAYFARSVVLPLLFAWVAAMTLKQPVTWLRTCHLPLPFAAVIVLGIFFGAVGFGTMWLGRPAVEWVKSAPEQLPRLKAKYKNILQPVLRFSAAASTVGNLEGAQSSTNAAPAVAVKDNHVAGTMFTWTGNVVARIVEGVVLTFLLLASGDTFMQKLAQMMPDRRDKKRAVEIGKEIQHSISRYLFTVSLINFGLGCAVALAFWLLGMPNPAMWGGVAAILNFLPFFGPTVGMVTVGLAGLVAFDTVGGALLPAGAYLLAHVVESYFVTPFALGQHFKLNPVIIFVTFIFCAWLWGVAGALLAVPLLVSLKVICERVSELSPVAEFFSP